MADSFSDKGIDPQCKRRERELPRCNFACVLHYDLFVRKLDAVSVHSQHQLAHSEAGALVAINEHMGIHYLPADGCRLIDDTWIKDRRHTEHWPSLPNRPKDVFERASVVEVLDWLDVFSAAELSDLFAVDRNYIIQLW